MKNRSAISADESGFRYPDRRNKPSGRLPVDVFGLCVDGGVRSRRRDSIEQLDAKAKQSQGWGIMV